MDEKRLQIIKERLSYTGGSTTDYEDAVALSKEVDRLRAALKAIAGTAGLNGTTAAKSVL